MSKKTITRTVTMARPSDKEVGLFYKLYHAAQRVEDRWCHNTVGTIADELSHCPNLTRQEKMFLLRAWQVLVDGSGGFGRFMGAFDTYVYNMQDPAVDHVAYKPSLIQLFGDAELLPVVIEAYQEVLAALEEKDQQHRLHAARLIDERGQLRRCAEAAEQDSKELEESLNVANAATQLWKERATATEQRLQQPAVPRELLDAMDEVIRISDRDHDAWSRAKDAISAYRAAIPNHVGNSTEKAEPATTAYRLADLAAAVNTLLDNDGSRGTFNVIGRYDALQEVERLIATASTQEGDDGGHTTAT